MTNYYNSEIEFRNRTNLLESTKLKRRLKDKTIGEYCLSQLTQNIITDSDISREVIDTFIYEYKSDHNRKFIMKK